MRLGKIAEFGTGSANRLVVEYCVFSIKVNICEIMPDIFLSSHHVKITIPRLGKNFHVVRSIVNVLDVLWSLISLMEKSTSVHESTDIIRMHKKN